MPKYTSQVKSDKSGEQVDSLIAGFLTQQGYKPARNQKGIEWRKGLFSYKYARYSYTQGAITIEVWNHVPYPGIGSLLMYFVGTGELKTLLRNLERLVSTNGSASVQKDHYGSTTTNNTAPTVAQALRTKARARSATSTRQQCPCCKSPIHIEEEGGRKYEICDECGWSRVAPTSELAESTEPDISEDISHSSSIGVVTPEGSSEGRETTTESMTVQDTPMPVEGKPTPEEVPNDTPRQAKTGIGGCLLYPLFVLIVQPFLLARKLCVILDASPAHTVIHWHYLIYDLMLLGAVVALLSLFVRRRAALPAMFIFFLMVFAIVSGVLTNAVWRFPNMGGDQMEANWVMLLQCLILIPFFVLDTRTKSIFIHQLDKRDPIDMFIKPIAGPAERLYTWLVHQGAKTVLYTIAFVVAVFLLGILVDTIVLYGIIG